jgi:hypothetical protein
MKNICPLCRQERQIVRSHIIPEFFLRAVRDDKGRAIAIPGSPRPARLVQQAFMHRLLCKDCEAFLNKEYEAPFLAFWRKAVPTIIWGPIYLLTVPDYARFKLFLLSVLWRAGVCLEGAFARVKLGEHESNLRQMLLERSPFTMHDFPVMGPLLLVPNSVQVAFTVVTPFETTWEGSPGYMFAFGGCLWHFVLRHEPLAVWTHEWMLMEDGRLGLPAIDLAQLGAIDRSFSNYLELANKKGWRNPWTKR